MTTEHCPQDADGITDLLVGVDAWRAELIQSLRAAAMRDAEPMRHADADTQVAFINRWRGLAAEYKMAGLAKELVKAIRDPRPALIDVAVATWPYPLRRIERHYGSTWIMAPVPGGGPVRTSFATGGTHHLKHRLAERDGGWWCRYCEVPLACGCNPADVIKIERGSSYFGKPMPMSDHVIPKYRGGHDGDDNRVLACESCNCSKADHTPAEWFAILRAKGEVIERGEVAA